MKPAERIQRLSRRLADTTASGITAQDTINRLLEDLSKRTRREFRLLSILSDAKDKLELYRKAHGGEYVGGVEYGELMRRMEEALNG
jgi:hypothetical protein